MFDNTFSVLSFSSINEISYNHTGDIQSSSNLGGQKSEDFNKNIKIEPQVEAKRRCCKRRKIPWTSTKVTSTLVDDGYAWRKYGQKAIHHTNHQRSYYRCTYKFDQGCEATKQVQKTDDEPSKYKITYNGYHTCKNHLRGPEMIFDSSNLEDSSIILSFETKGLIDEKQVDSYFPSMKHDQPKEALFPLESTYSQSVLLQDGIRAEVFEPVSVELLEYEHQEMISLETYLAGNDGYEIDNLTLFDFSDNLLNNAQDELACCN
ncbi:probable WRKY transcription factor 70 [Cynara cardunculus var. scolymus]|uniref:DNA-binding WRKY n=1 Tax=Cynara cardunculus var. scolymus TaxID=59895 RepID=A0A103XQD3_CYNCS|nr:probable WRKY transcription factor 70 [Cynara cardunculus var. scolymus]KVH94953.1 DNA-binding WRKY [Cynara cardunculus var. scolymus]